MTDNRTVRQANAVTGALWVAAPIWYLLCEAVTAAWYPGYNYAHFFISDLGVSEATLLDGRPMASAIPQVMNAGFIGAGLLFFIGLIVIAPHLKRGAVRWFFLLAGAMHSAGIVFVALVPGGPSGFETGLIIIHMVGAIGLIVGGNIAAILSGRAFSGLGLPSQIRYLGPVLGMLGFVSGALLVAHALVPDGVSERGSVYTFFLWQFLMGVILLAHSKRASTVAPGGSYS
ncbi:DUF998 domain-containing protein [Leucobacter sp. UT-8R-CII-1-4]|uniref:DUF998 domain-containing protein n=1 Tax=Leucobacter sp. UT-8R-CII-1-4 TaxID=3040075 RepID=UPI0024A9BECD|nr:DUF998 domain-containing protein [Leucobacter sp. UT-8R-CII-1-4]MDI6024289.1 DUF998 domain-containing protein [Leucobacter sp. UT-8R-CII-1-4]